MTKYFVQFITSKIFKYIHICNLIFSPQFCPLYTFYTEEFPAVPPHSTRSPFVTLVSQCAQSGRWSSFGKRVWFTESHIVLLLSFYLLLYLLNFLLIKWKKGVLYQVKQLNHILLK